MSTERTYTDLVGQRFGSLVVVERSGSTPTKQAVWRCLCDCGATTHVKTGHLRSGNTRSCGCGARKGGGLIRGHARRGSKTPEYVTWEAMNRRCHTPTSQAYRYYGARGVVVCEQWRHDFAAFIAYIGPKPSPAHSIDRIDPAGNYEPGNVRWATRAEQDANRRTTRGAVIL